MQSSVEQNKNKWLVFIGIVLLSFGCYLDYTIVNVALPTIQQHFQANLISLQWVMNIYFLALCILATIMGCLGDLYGRRRCFYLGAGIFTIASIIAGFSPNLIYLILGRLLQGVGAAIVLPLGLSLLPQSFPKKEAVKAIAWFGSIGGAALALGPVLGGIILTYWGWRWIFLINVPLFVVGMLFCLKSLKESPRAQNVFLDLKGMFFLATTLSGIVLSLIHSQQYGWQDPFTLVYFAIGLISAFLLVKVEKNQLHPLINFSDFNSLLFCAGAILCFFAGMFSAVTLFFDPLYLQIIQHQSPQYSGFILSAIPVAVFLTAFLVDRLIDQFGIINTVAIGLALASLSAFLHLFFNNNTSLTYVIIAFVSLGGMWAIGNIASIIAAQTAVGQHRLSAATGTIVTMFNIGGSIGITIAVVVYNFVTNYKFNHSANIYQSQLDASQFSALKATLANPADILQLSSDNVVYQIFNEIFINGFTGVMGFLLISSLLALCFILRWKMKENIN